MALQGGPIMPPDVFVLLCGEDGLVRMERAVFEFANFAGWADRKRLNEEGRPSYQPMILLSGGHGEEPYLLSARKLAPKVLGKGIRHDRLLFDHDSETIREQAVNTIDRAKEDGWVRLMLITSAYHLPRAFLTFLKAIQEADLEEKLEMVPATMTDPTPWWAPPDGMTTSRIELFEQELITIDESDDCATYEDGLAYLEFWETHEPDIREMV